MNPKSATRDEFTQSNGTVVHEPTGATFVRNDRGIRATDWGLAGLTPGAQYDPAQIKDEACGMLLEECPPLAPDKPNS
jgi:hypothetical protein